MTVRQDRNDQLVSILRPDFQHRAEPNFAASRAASTLLSIPGLVAAWPTSIVRLDSQVDRVRDIGGGGYHLRTLNTPQFGYDNLAPYMDADGTNQYAYRADGGPANWADITGADNHIPTALRGLFLGGFFYFDDAAPPAAQEILIGKRSAAAGDFSYWLRREAANGYGVFHVSNDGTAITSINSSPLILEQNTWYYIAGIFDNSANEIRLHVDTNVYTDTFNNTIYDSDADFAIASYSGGGGYFDGKASCCFLSQIGVSDTISRYVYEQLHPMFYPRS